MPPEVFDVSRNWDEVVSFLDDLRSNAFGFDSYERKRQRKNLVVDFSAIKQITPLSAVLLAADTDRWCRFGGVKPIVIDIDRWQPEVLAMLKGLGFFELVKATNSPPIEVLQASSTRMIKLMSGKRIVRNFTRQLQHTLETIGGPLHLKTYFHDGISEAITNVCHHAYPNPRPDNCPKWFRHHWWASGSFDASSGRLSIIFLDQGVGIPQTLPRKAWYERLQGLMSSLGLGNDDSAMIEAALELGRSARDIQGGGNGLPQMKEYVDASRAGSFRVISGAGEILYTKGQRIERGPVRSRNIGGTIIQWEIEQ